jgi:hypothetical protein
MPFITHKNGLQVWRLRRPEKIAKGSRVHHASFGPGLVEGRTKSTFKVRFDRSGALRDIGGKFLELEKGAAK